MLKRICSLLLVIFFIGINGHAQSYQKTDLGIKTVINSTAIEVQFYSPSTVRIVKSPAGTHYTKESLSVIKQPQKTTISIRKRGDLLNLKTSLLDVALDLKTGAIAYSTPKGESLLKEKENSANFTPFNDAGSKTFNVQQSFVLDKDEPIYGLGQQQQGRMSQRGVTLHMIQGNTDDYIPFFQSVKGYGVFWDNYSPTVFTDKPEGTSFKSDVGDCIDYYFMYGGNADGVIARMRDLTGQAPMFPLWTFGYWQSKERYKSQDELVDVVKHYRKIGVPLDGIIQDCQYW
jgi:alpha-D-xyloside xylohydrolase